MKAGRVGASHLAEFVWRWEVVADPAAGAGTIILRRLLEVRKPVLFPSIYLDGQDVKDTCSWALFPLWLMIRGHFQC